jgi:ankyrin repeat protein
MCGVLAAVLLVAGCTGERTVYRQAELGEHRDLVRRLVMEEGQDVNQVDEESGLTPLQIAVIRGHEEMVHALLRLGANPNVHDAQGRTPLEDAYAFGHDDIVDMLLSYGAEGGHANPEAKDPG